MTKLFLCLIFVSGILNHGTAQAECDVLPLTSTPEVNAIVQEKMSTGWFPLTEARCKFLKERKLRLHVSSHSLIHAGVTTAWVSLRLARKDGLLSEASTLSTQLETGGASSVLAGQLVIKALEATILNLPYEKAARELAGQR
jgi:hypothetical protein